MIVMGPMVISSELARSVVVAPPPQAPAPAVVQHGCTTAGAGARQRMTWGVRSKFRCGSWTIGRLKWKAFITP